MKHFGIVCAMPDEAQPFKRRIQFENTARTGATKFWKGLYEGKQITLVQSGVGKVHAAVATQILISQHAPDAIFSCGAAGSLDPQYQIGDIIIGEQTAQHDYGFVLPGKFIPYSIRIQANKKARFFKKIPADATLLRLAKTIEDQWKKRSRIFYGSILTGDQIIVSSEKCHALAEQFHASAVDMESAVVAQVACMNDIPFLAVRGISDHADEKTLPIDISKLDPNEFGAYPAAPLGEKIRLLTKAVGYFAQHPSAFALSLQARQNIKKAANSSATFTLNIIRSLI